jgi:hypothetical protein
MSITRYNPNTVFLGGDRTQINDLAVSEAVTPGHLVERFNNAGVTRWRKHATAAGATAMAVATEQSMLNLGPDDAYAANDLAEVSVLHKGATAWMFIASGQNITFGQKLESAGNGTLRALAAGVALATSLENTGAVTAQTRLRVEAI